MRIQASPLLVLALACGSAANDPQEPQHVEPASTEPSTAIHEVSTGPTASNGRYEVHEWGLVDVARDGTIELATGPGRQPAAQPGTQVVRPPAATRKPVLYFHLLEGEVQLRTIARMQYGAMLERYPTTTMSGREVTWENVRIVARQCQRTSYPMPGSPPCDNIPDGYCEASELQAYEASDASCLVVDGHDYNHLFYRGGGTGLTLPLEPRPVRDGLSVRNHSTHAVPFVIHISGGTTPSARRDQPAREPRRVEMPAVSVHRFEAVAAGSDSIGPSPIPPHEAVAALRRELARVGLTPPEIQAFMNAWETPVFRSPNLREALLYVLPAELVNSVSTVEFDPAPTEFKRAMVVRVEL